MEKKNIPIIWVILADILLTGVILLVFAYFHHGMPYLQSRKTADMVTEAPAEELIVEPEVEEEVQPEELPDNRTEWQIKFEDKFSDELRITENSYKSPTLSIEINDVTYDNGKRTTNCYIADIYVAEPGMFTAYTAHDQLKYYGVQSVEEIDADSNAVLAINGDFFSYQGAGFMVRNGEIYRNDEAYCDICVLFEDGSMGCYKSGTYRNADLIERGAVQVWNFGPSLLDENGEPYEYYETSAAISYPNPRSAVGYYEPGHYCFVVCDGRSDESYGLTLAELAELFKQQGCTMAYNLDGGASAIMMFMHERYSIQSNGADRSLSDLLIIRESEAAK